jgi:2-hydroxy-3-oxopropionate reductase
MTKPIGFIDLGVMGRPMAARLIDAGYEVVVVRRSSPATRDLVELGADQAQTPAAVAAGTDTVITMLPDSPDVEQVVLGAGGVAEGIPAGGLLIDMSSIAPAVSRRVAETVHARGAQALDAPVSGGETGAREGTLSVMVGGPEEAFGRAQPVLSVLGEHIVHVGGHGAGQVAKAANQVIVAGTIAAVAEALTLARRAGVDPERVREALPGGFADSRILRVHGRRMLEGAFALGFRIRLQAKDARWRWTWGRR